MLRITPYVGASAAAAVAIPTIAPDDSQDASSVTITADSSDAAGVSVSYAVGVAGSTPDTSGNVSSSTNSTAIDSALANLLGPDDSDDDTGFDPDSTDLPDDSEFTSAVPVSGVGAF
jgi:hypothetical protein